MICLTRPSSETVARFLEQQRGQPFTYPDPGLTRNEEAPSRFAVDHNRRQVGSGQAAFEAACAAVRRWEMYNIGWLEICHPLPPIETGRVAASLARFGGVWWLNACRIVYLLDEPRRFGFAYGTLPDHAETGEERFSIEWREDGSVWYDIYAFSRPYQLLARLGTPMVRRLQRRFGAESLAAMEGAVRKNV